MDAGRRVASVQHGVIKVFGSEDSKHRYYYGIGWGRWGWGGEVGMGWGRGQ